MGNHIEADFGPTWTVMPMMKSNVGTYMILINHELDDWIYKANIVTFIKSSRIALLITIDKNEGL